MISLYAVEDLELGFVDNGPTDKRMYIEKPTAEEIAGDFGFGDEEPPSNSHVVVHYTKNDPKSHFQPSL